MGRLAESEQLLTLEAVGGNPAVLAPLVTEALKELESRLANRVEYSPFAVRRALVTPPGLAICAQLAAICGAPQGPILSVPVQQLGSDWSQLLAYVGKAKIDCAAIPARVSEIDQALYRGSAVAVALSTRVFGHTSFFQASDDAAVVLVVGLLTAWECGILGRVVLDQAGALHLIEVDNFDFSGSVRAALVTRQLPFEGVSPPPLVASTFVPSPR
jgi:hypothetical protein